MPHFADGTFTRIEFCLIDGELRIATPKRHQLGFAGDMVKTITNPTYQTYRFI